MKIYSWILSLSALGFGLSGARALADEAADAGIELPACMTLNEETLSEPVSLVWKNGRDTPVRLLFYYKDTDGLWQSSSSEIAGKGQKSVEVLSRCVYWYAKRGKAIYTPKTEKNALSSVPLSFDGKSVKSIMLDLAGREGIEFGFTLK